jgi:O-methyltransferase
MSLVQSRPPVWPSDPERTETVLGFARKLPWLAKLAVGELRLRDRIDFATDEWRFREIYRKYRAFTMIPEREYIENLRLVTQIEARELPGNVVECGTWRGGMIAGIADVLGPYRRYYLFDSYEGLPPAREIDGTVAREWQTSGTSPDYHNNCTASEEEARSAMAMSAAKDYQIVKGWFNETLPARRPSEPIALLRMDADWYESTKCILDNLASLVVPGGMIIVDDYFAWDGCAQAVNEFAALRKWRIRQSPHADICFIVTDLV